MKSVKAFVILILVFYVCLFIIDWQKATTFAVSYHSWAVLFKTAFLVTGGLLIMFLTLERPVFKMFLIFYVAIWVIYFIVKKVAPGFEGVKPDGQPQPNKVIDFYLKITQLYTPLPFIIFWILNHVFLSPERGRK